MSTPGTVYLLHFDEPIGHSQHYLGWTSRRVQDRIQDHIDGTGAKLPALASELGVSPELVRTWDGTPHLEKALKVRKNSRGLCPICRPLRNAYERDRRASKRGRA